MDYHSNLVELDLFSEDSINVSEASKQQFVGPEILRLSSLTSQSLASEESAAFSLSYCQQFMVQSRPR